MRAPRCADCSGTEMECGFLLERVTGGEFETKWVRGAPEPSFWRGTKVSDRERISVEAYRCPQCGALKLLAPPV